MIGLNIGLSCLSRDALWGEFPPFCNRQWQVPCIVLTADSCLSWVLCKETVKESNIMTHVMCVPIYSYYSLQTRIGHDNVPELAQNITPILAQFWYIAACLPGCCMHLFYDNVIQREIFHRYWPKGKGECPGIRFCLQCAWAISSPNIMSCRCCDVFWTINSACKIDSAKLGQKCCHFVMYFLE